MSRAAPTTANGRGRVPVSSPRGISAPIKRRTAQEKWFNSGREARLTHPQFRHQCEAGWLIRGAS
jgi:hypothetical protein